MNGMLRSRSAWQRRCTRTCWKKSVGCFKDSPTRVGALAIEFRDPAEPTHRRRQSTSSTLSRPTPATIPELGNGRDRALLLPTWFPRNHILASDCLAHTVYLTAFDSCP